MPALMSGFPPAAPGQVTLANWRTPPFNRWGFQHVREIVPSANIAADAVHRWHLPAAPLDLSDLAPDAFLTGTDTDALVVLHQGRIVFEHYAHGMTMRTPHILMSVSKSMLAIIAAILTGRGLLDRAALLTDIIPELSGSAWAGARLHHLLDMRVGVAFDENYEATDGDIIAYRKAQGWNPLDPGEAPSDLRGFFARLTRPDGPHGARFHYVSPNTDLLGWVIERATGRRFADLVSELLWRPMGAAEDAYITVDRLGAPRCAGGMCMTARDLARVGQLMAQGGQAFGQQIIPAAWLEDIVLRGAAPLLFGFGVNGQHLFVDKKNQIVIAKFSSQAAAVDVGRLQTTLAWIDALRARIAS